MDHSQKRHQKSLMKPLHPMSSHVTTTWDSAPARRGDQTWQQQLGSLFTCMKKYVWDKMETTQLHLNYDEYFILAYIGHLFFHSSSVKWWWWSSSLGLSQLFQIPFPHITSCPCQGTPSAVHLRWRPLDLPVPCIQRPAGSGLISVDADDADIQSWKCWNLSTLGWTLDCASLTERARREPAGSRQNINISYLQTGKTSELKWIFHCNACSP